MSRINRLLVIPLFLLLVAFVALARADDTFSPSDLPGLTLWLDGGDPDTFFQDLERTVSATEPGDWVRVWVDKSPAGHDATNDTPAATTESPEPPPSLIKSSSRRGAPYLGSRAPEDLRSVYFGKRLWFDLDEFANQFNQPEWTLFVAVRFVKWDRRGVVLMGSVDASWDHFRGIKHAAENCEAQHGCVRVRRPGPTVRGHQAHLLGAVLDHDALCDDQCRARGRQGEQHGGQVQQGDGRARHAHPP